MQSDIKNYSGEGNRERGNRQETIFPPQIHQEHLKC